MRRLRSLALVAAAVAMLLAAFAQPAQAEADAKWRYIDLSIDQVYTPVVGFFNRDARSDILWYGAGTRPDSIWFGTATPGVFTKRTISISGNALRPIVGDFAGDRYSDIYWYCPGDCPDTLWVSNGSSKYFASVRTPQQRGYYYIETIQTWNTGGVRSNYGGYVLRDRAGGKDDIFWYWGVNDSTGQNEYNEMIWLFADSGSGKVSNTAEVTANRRFIPIIGNFGGSGHDDILLYTPNAEPDFWLLEDGSGGATVYEADSPPISGYYWPTILQGSRPKGWVGAPAQPAFDSILWYDIRGCGNSSQVWQFLPSGQYNDRRVAPLRAGGTGCYRDDSVRTFDGTSSAIIHRTHGSRGNPDFDIQITATSDGASSAFLTDGYRDIDGTSAMIPGDFNGDGKADVFWYVPGKGRDQLWYSRR